MTILVTQLEYTTTFGAIASALWGAGKPWNCSPLAFWLSIYTGAILDVLIMTFGRWGMIEKKGLWMKLKGGNRRIILSPSRDFHGAWPRLVITSACARPHSISFFNQHHLQPISGPSHSSAPLKIPAKMKPVIGVMQAWSWYVFLSFLHQSHYSASICEVNHGIPANQLSSQHCALGLCNCYSVNHRRSLQIQ